METFSLISMIVTALICFMASVHTKFMFERLLFAWVSCGFLLNAALTYSHYFDLEMRSFITDSVLGIIILVFACISLVRSFNPKLNLFFWKRSHA